MPIVVITPINSAKPSSEHQLAGKSSLNEPSAVSEGTTQPANPGLPLAEPSVFTLTQPGRGGYRTT